MRFVKAGYHPRTEQAESYVSTVLMKRNTKIDDSGLFSGWGAHAVINLIGLRLP